MKLIIDIPEEIVTAIQNGQDYRYDIHTAIAQGKPYDTSGDLISREALKKVISEKLGIYIDGTFNNKLLFGLIDNAPTVEAIPTPNWYTVYEDVKGIFERPQGEWIDTGSGQECSICKEIQYGYDSFRHFCPNCGAKMKGGTE